MKAKSVLLSMLFPALCFSQDRAKLERDTIFYAGRTFAVGDTVQLAYGSGVDKKFVFVGVGSSFGGYEELESDAAKNRIRIEKVVKSKGKIAARGKMIERKMKSISGSTINIDIEGAVDNKEIY